MKVKQSCRFCSGTSMISFVDLGLTPLSNSFISKQKAITYETFYPLHAYVCPACHLVQLEQFESPQHIFNDYVYFSSYSDSWLRHARRFAEEMSAAFALDSRSKVVEIASNDGYLLQYFLEKGVDVLGIEPAGNVAAAAIEKGIPTVIDFFGCALARKLVRRHAADLLIGNNVLAHVPDLNDFVAGLKLLLKDGGVITMEFPHLLQLMRHNQFDTIYHEHFSYFSFLTVQRVFAKFDLTIFDVEELPTHGGSLRIYAKHRDDGTKPATDRVERIARKELQFGLDSIQTYLAFSEKVKQTKRNILSRLIGLKNEGSSLAGYGAPAKGNTLLNYCGIGKDFIDYVVDKNPYKQQMLLPGTRIPVAPPERLQETKPDYVIIMPWNLKDEIIGQTAYIRQWGGKWLTLIPEVAVIS